MDWFHTFDGYCERTDPSYWSEPVNAVTNAAFLIAAVIMWRRCGGLPGGKMLSVIVFAIGVGSFLFHTHATLWASLTDVVPIGIFILVYLFLTNLHIGGWPRWAAVIGTLGFLPFSAGITLILNNIPFFQISNFYWSVPILLLIYAVILRGQFPSVARGFVIGAGLLVLSITLRSLDETFCRTWPIGTHFAWHILNGMMLGWMIEVYRRHMLEAPANQG